MEHLQNISVAELLALKQKAEEKKVFHRMASSRNQARKRAKELGITVEEYLTTEHTGRGKRYITWEQYMAFVPKPRRVYPEKEPEPEGLVKRGRGRPPKPKEETEKRPRGRPRKVPEN